jgi:hypothetical protein
MKNIVNSVLLIPISLILNSTLSFSGDHTFYITDYEAIGDSSTLNTKAIQNAIDVAAEAGGGIVIVPPGKYITGSIELRDNIELRVMAGAMLLGSGKIEDYTIQEGFTQHGISTDRRYLVSVMDVKNVIISGKGTIDGRGSFFWEPREDWPGFIRAKAVRPNALLEVSGSNNVTIRDITLSNSANWTCHILHSQNITIQGINIFSDLMAPNSDGIDISGCQMVRVSDCNIITGDDAIVLKTWKNGLPCEDITVINCNLESLCAALKLGTESYEDYRRITFSNCTVKKSSRLFAIYVRDGATIEDVTVSNISGDTNAPLVLNRPLQLMITKRNPDSKLGTIRNVLIQNIACKTEGRILFTCDEGGLMESIYLSDIILEYPFIEDPKEIAGNTTSSQFPRNIPDARGARAAMVAYNIKDFRVENFEVKWPGEKIPENWKIPVRIENGSFTAKHRFGYESPRQTEFNAIWGRKLEGGFIDAPDLKSSDGLMKVMDIKESSMKKL